MHYSAANAAFQCEAGSIPSVCPEGDSKFLGCFPENLICNLDSNCPGGVDEINCTDHDSGKFERIICSIPWIANSVHACSEHVCTYLGHKICNLLL